MNDYKLRRDSLISPWGIGSIAPFPNDESLMVAGIDRWFDDSTDQDAFEIIDYRLSNRMEGKRFFCPPDYRTRTKDNNEIKIPAVRFPLWNYCPICGNAEKLTPGAQPVKCHGDMRRKGSKQSYCNKNIGNSRKLRNLIPERFIAVCESGHIEDFPITEWIHQDGYVYHPESCKINRSTGGGSASLAGIRYTCTCGASRSMAGAFSKGALDRINYRCHGNHPWISGDNDICGKSLLVLQRGASNVWYPEITSGINIPIVPLVLMDVVHKRMQTEFDPYENLKDIKPGQKMKIGKAVLEVISISKKEFVFKDATVTRCAHPWSYTWYQYLEPVDSERRLSSHETLFKEIRKKEELASVNNTIQRLLSDRGATTSTTVMLTTKASLLEFTEDLIISDRQFRDIFTIGEFDSENKWYKISNNNHNIPQITVATEVYKITECLNEKVEPTIDKFIVTQEKVKELLSNQRTFERLLSLKKPMIVFLSEKDYEKFSAFEKYEFALFHWKPSTLKDVSFRNDGNRYCGTIFENITEKTSNASNAKFKLRICSNELLKTFYKMLRTITQNSRDYDEPYRKMVHVFWNLFKNLTSNSLPDGTRYLDSLTDIENRWNSIKERYYVDVQTRINTLLELGSTLVCNNTNEKYDLILEEVTKIGNDKSIAILLPDYCLYEDKLESKLTECFPKKEIDVFRYSDYISKQNNNDEYKTYRELIVTWFDRNEYTQIVNTYSYWNLAFVLFDFEESWRRKFRKEVNSHLDHKRVVASMKKMGLKSQAFRNVPFDYKEDDSELYVF